MIAGHDRPLLTGAFEDWRPLLFVLGGSYHNEPRINYNFYI